MLINRRNLLAAAGATLAAGHVTVGNARTLPVPPTANLASDAGYWDAVRGLYRFTREIVNLENGYWGIMPEPVMETYIRHTEMVNYNNTMWARGGQAGEALRAARAALAEALGVAVEEVVFTRGATEALQKLIGGYNRLRPGDAVLYSDLDYGAMQAAMNWLQHRRGARVVRFAIPEPATRDNVLDAYEQQLRANPDIRLVLVTHVSHRTGLLMPVRDIVALCEANGADVIVDAAHSWGQVDVTVADMAAPFIGFNLHKWINAPLGVGCFYIRRDRVADIDPDFAEEGYAADDIRARIHTGTSNFAAFMTVPRALEIHREIGAAAKEQRFRYLRNRWVAAAREMPQVDVLTPDDPTMTAGITSFRIRGRVSAEDNNAVVAALRDEHGVLTVRRSGIDRGQAIRVTPAPYTSEADVDRFIAALRAIAPRFG